MPESAALSGLLAALVKKVSAADRTPVADGVNVTLTAQLSPARSVPPQVFAEMAKSAAFGPVNEMLEMVSVALPLFVSVTVCAALGSEIEIVTFPNDSVVGLKFAAGVGEATPVPESAALSGLEEALVKNVSDADLAPNADGVNVTLTVQLSPAARLAPQVFTEIAKSPAFAPLSEMLVIVTVAGPVFVRVTLCALLVPATTTLPNARLAGLRLTTNGFTPVPDNDALFGLPAALVVNVKEAERTPVADGENVTLTAQFRPAPKLAPQVFAEMLKSAAFAPVRVILVMVNEAVPLLVSVTVCALVVAPTTMFPKERLPGFRVTAGTGGVTPVPESVALSGLLDALVRKVKDAVLAPSAVGVKVTLTMQLLPAARLAPHGLLEMAKSPAFAPVSEIFVIVTADGPVFVNVTVLALLVIPSPVLGNVKLVGLRLTANAGTPVPVSAALLGLVEAFVVKVSEAALTPVVEGVNVTPTKQFAPTARVPPHVVEEMV